MLRHKFNAKITECDGIKFASKKEASHYKYLTNLKKAGDILFFLRQVPIHLAGQVKYLCDFQIFWANGEVTFEDVKGMKTNMYTLKKKQVEATYPIEIKEV